MNYLAHLHLSGENQGVMLGNFIADGIRGKQYLGYPRAIQQGILMHRMIDQFTDKNLIVRQSKKRLFPSQGHYASVVVDMMYDHFLAKNWSAFSSVPLELFAQKFYSYLDENSDLLPDRVLYLKPYLIQQNWLVSYVSTEGLQRALTGMHKRTSHQSKMDTAVSNILQDYDNYETEFLRFYPILLEEVNKFKASLS